MVIKKKHVPELSFNERRIIEFLRINGPTSRADLAKQANLKAPTLTRLTSTLMAANLIKDVKTKRLATPGQPPKLLGINPNGIYTLGIAIYPDEIILCVVDLSGKIIASECQSLDSTDVDLVLTLAYDLYGKLINQIGNKKSKLLGCGVAMPGYFSKQSQMIKHIPQFRLWTDINIAELFSKALDMDVWLENDGNAAALSEIYYGFGRVYENFVSIYLSYGIGGGVVVDRKLYRGHHGNAAEFGGFFPFNQKRPTGGDLIAFLNKKGCHYSSLLELNQSLRQSPILDEWLDRATEQLGKVIHIIHYTFDPAAIVISGILPNWLIAELVARINRYEGIFPEKGVTPPDIVASEFDRESQQIGAAIIPLYKCFASKNYGGRALKGW